MYVFKIYEVTKFSKIIPSENTTIPYLCTQKCPFLVSFLDVKIILISKISRSRPHIEKSSHEGLQNDPKNTFPILKHRWDAL